MVLDLAQSTDTPVADRALPSLLRRQAAARPEKVALCAADRTLTYDQLYAESRRYAAGLSALGVAPGEAVLIMLDNHVDFVLTWFGTNLAGAIQVPVNTAYLGDMLAHVLVDSAAVAIVVEEQYADRLAQVWDRPHRIRTVVVRAPGGSPPPADRPWGTAHRFESLRAEDEGEPVEVRAWDPMGYLYTSGTTGPSKAVVVAHAHAYTYSMTHWITEEDRIMACLPLFHIGGQWAGVYTALVAGASAAVVPRFSASSFWRDAARFECTQTLLIGAMASFLMKQPPGPADREHTMRRLGVAPVIPEIREFERRFGVTTGSAYGLTESATPIVTPYGATEPGLAGWLRPEFDARIVDDNDMEVEPGRAGELLLRPHESWTTMMGYLGRPAETARSWRNQWFHTGDFLYRDEAGRYFFVDRKKDAMRVRGENVSSYEVESFINQHEAVVESACVATPSEASEDDIRAFVVLAEPGSVAPEALLDFLVDRLPYFMIPRYVDFVPELPKTHTTRVQKDALRGRPLTGASWDRERAGYRVSRHGRR